METTQPSKRKNRSKSTSSNKSPTEPAEHTETAPNLNGNKDGGSEEQETANNDKPAEETTTDENKPTQGRKRKASEMKSDSSGGEETPAEKETKEVTEPEKKVEVKVEPELSDSPTDTKKEDITMPPKQTLGKGKRARIPNKRYSDIMITSPKLEKIRKVENGEVQDNTNITEKENTIESENSIGSSLKSSMKDSLGTSRNSTGSPSGHLSKRQKFPVDLTNPNYLKPFQFGWKRELVYRATTDSTMKRNGDIYYYTPNGKKVRSMREVSENLKNKELSLDDFTFYKEPLGLDDPEKEIIRDAKVKYGTVKEHTPKTTPRVKVASPKPPPPAPTTPTPTPPATAPSLDTPKSTKNSTKGGGFKVKLPNKAATPKGKIDKKQKENEAEMEVGTYPPSWITPQTKTKTGTTKWGNNGPISTIKSAAASATTSSTSSSTVSVPPKLQRIPKPQDANITNTPQIVKSLPPVPKPELPKLTPRPGLASGPKFIKSLPPVPKPELPKLTPRPGLASGPKFIKVNNISEQNASESKSLVGSVTTWFPPSSTIQVANDQTRVNDVETHSPPRPQFVEFLGNKKYLIVPKHNILSVSPAIASVNSKSEDFVTTPDLLNMGSDNVDEIIAEAAKIPPSPRLSAEEIKSEPHSPAHLTLPDDNLPEPMDVDTPPSIPMEIDPDPDSQKGDTIESDIAAATAIVPVEDTNTTGNVAVNEVIEREDEPSENAHDTQASLPNLPKEDDAVTTNLKDLQDQEQDSAGSDQERTSARTSKLNKSKSTPTTAEDNKSINVHMDSKFMENYLQNLAYGYGTLLYVFQYLKVQDLLRAGCVCTMWRDVANHPILWRTVRMKNSQIHSFEGLADTLQKHGTVNLDLRKMLLPNGGDDLWPSFSNATGPLI
ncbi:F-box-like [Popillia japonica]|uniref:F-box-like n=1 Tax=Popillia japonica TaxID=7064 RepID=A0AAW1L471_POPJA